MSDGMGREFMYLSSHAINRYFIPNWGIYSPLDCNYWFLRKETICSQSSKSIDNACRLNSSHLTISFISKPSRQLADNRKVVNCLSVKMLRLKTRQLTVCEQFLLLLRISDMGNFHPYRLS